MTTGSMIIDQQCAFIQEQKAIITTHQLKESLDTIIPELNELTAPNRMNTIRQILVSIHIDDVKSYGEPDIINHQLFVIVRDCYLEILRRWRSGAVLDMSSYEVFLQISISLDLMCVHLTDANVHHFQKLLIYQPLVDELRSFLTEIATQGKYLQDPQTNAINFVMKAIYRIFRGRISVQNNPLLTPLLDAIVSCMCSPFFVSIFKQVTEIKQLNEAQTLLLDTCPDYFSWYGGTCREKFCTVIRTALLSSFAHLLLSHVSSWRQWSKLMITAVKKVGNIILDFDMQHDVVYSQEVYSDCCKIVDCFVSILSSATSAETQKIDSDLVGMIVLQLYLLTLDQTLLNYIKNQQLAPVLLKLVNVVNEWAQFHAYRILAWILTEQDIRVLANSSVIAHVFLTFLENVIDDSSKFLRLRSLLRSLKCKSSLLTFITIFSTK